MGNNKYMKNIELMKLKFTEQQQQQQQQTHFGVITRARALALQRAQAAKDTSSSYLQLRSRRLQKPPPANRTSRFKRNSNNEKTKKRRNEGKAGNDEKNSAAGVDASCGENFLETEAIERKSRETTPCSLIRNPDAIRTPGSTTKRTASAGAVRTQNSSLIMPTTQQMNEFFGDTENEDQRRFIEKYNFDVINDKPLPGRYEWEKIDP